MEDGQRCQTHLLKSDRLRRQQRISPDSKAKESLESISGGSPEKDPSALQFNAGLFVLACRNHS